MTNSKSFIGNMQNLKGFKSKEINIEDAISPDLENKYMKIFEGLISQKTI